MINTNRFFRSVAILSGGTAFVQFLAILASPILTRLYTPEEFGALAVFGSTLSMFAVVSSFRYEYAITLPEKNIHGANLLSVCLILVTLISVLSLILVLFFGVKYLEISNAEILGGLIWFLPLGVLFAGSYQALSYWTIRNKEYSEISLTRVFQGVISLIIQIGGGYIGFGVAALIFAQVATHGTGILRLARNAFQAHGEIFKNVSLDGVREVSIRYKRFPLISSSSALINQVGLVLPTLLLSVLYGIEVAGWFALCHRLVAVPSQVIGSAVAHVFMGEAPVLIREGGEGLHQLFLSTMKKLMIFGTIPIVVLSISGFFIFEPVFGENWASAGVYLAILGPSYALQFVSSPLALTLQLIERQEIAIKWDIARLFLVSGAIYIASVLKLSSVYAIGFMSLMSFILYLVLLYLSYQASTYVRK